LRLRYFLFNFWFANFERTKHDRRNAGAIGIVSDGRLEPQGGAAMGAWGALIMTALIPDLICYLIEAEECREAHA
jgi:hypothetical protein